MKQTILHIYLLQKSKYYDPTNCYFSSALSVFAKHNYKFKKNKSWKRCVTTVWNSKKSSIKTKTRCVDKIHNATHPTIVVKKINMHRYWVQGRKRRRKQWRLAGPRVPTLHPANDGLNAGDRMHAWRVSYQQSISTETTKLFCLLLPSPK